MKELFEHEGEPIFDVDIKKILKKDAIERDKILADWKRDFVNTFCSDASGRRVLFWFIHNTYIFRAHTEHNSSAYSVLAKNELGQEILDIIGAEEVLRALILVKRENTTKEVKKDE